MIYAIGLIILGLAPAPQWVCDPALTALFTPSRPEVGRYEICTTPHGIGDVTAMGAADGVHYGEMEALEPLDAFGAAGPYNRGALARLYGGSRVQVARGWAQRG